MNEVRDLGNFEPTSFDYSQLDDETSAFLEQRVRNMESIADDTRYRMGKELFQAQERLADHYKGTFVKWFESLGLDKDNVYFWINEFKFSRNLENTKQALNFGSAPKSLKKDVMKKNAPNEAKQAVLNGDITTHKEYVALEKKLKQREQELSDKDAQIADQQAELEDNRKTQLEMSQQIAEANKRQPEPKVITKTVTKEVPVKPDDYDELKANVARLQRQKDDAAKQLDEANEKLRDYEDIDKQNRKAEHWKSRGRLSVYQISSHITDFLAANTLLSEDKEAACDAGDEALASYDKKLDDLQKWIDDQRNITSGRRTVEGEIINEH